jgi:hypothetical protein
MINVASSRKSSCVGATVLGERVSLSIASRSIVNAFHTTTQLRSLNASRAPSGLTVNEAKWSSPLQLLSGVRATLTASIEPSLHLRIAPEMLFSAANKRPPSGEIAAIKEPVTSRPIPA